LVLQSDGKPEKAESLLRDALARQEKLTARPDALPADRSEQNRTHIALGALYQVSGQSLAARNPIKSREELARAESEFRSAVDGFKSLVKQYPKEPDFHYQQALSTSALAGLLAARGQRDGALRQWGMAADLLAPLADQHPEVSGYRLDLGRIYNDRALNCARMARLSDAAEQWGRARTTLTELVRIYPKDVAARQELAKVENNLAVLALKGKRLDEATAAYRRSVAALEGLPAGNQPGPDYRHSLMLRHRELALQLTDTGAPSRDVEAEWRRVIELCRNLADEAPNNPQYANDRSIAIHQLAQYLIVQNRTAAARTLLEESIAAQRAALKLNPAPAYRATLAGHLNLLLEVQFQLDDYAAAADAATELAALTGLEGSDRHKSAAEALARCAARAAADSKIPEEKRLDTARGYADRAMAELKEAVKSGFKDSGELKKKDFDVLREREDFKGLIKQLDG
jgi:tetratricopeptide (TPR) repeat protein